MSYCIFHYLYEYINKKYLHLLFTRDYIYVFIFYRIILNSPFQGIFLVALLYHVGIPTHARLCILNTWIGYIDAYWGAFFFEERETDDEICIYIETYNIFLSRGIIFHVNLISYERKIEKNSFPSDEIAQISPMPGIANWIYSMSQFLTLQFKNKIFTVPIIISMYILSKI